jgi:hypothetical protein
MPRLTSFEQQEIIRFIEADKPLPDKYRFLLFEERREVELVWNSKTSEVEEQWTGDFIFGNEWQSFRTKKDRRIYLESVFHEISPGPAGARNKIAVKVADIFGNDTMTIIEVRL